MSDNKYKMRLSLNSEQSGELELCCFCKRLSYPFECGKCEYYENGYIDNKCPGLIPVENQGERLQAVMDARCPKK